MDLEIARKQKGIAWPGTPVAPPLSSFLEQSGSTLYHFSFHSITDILLSSIHTCLRGILLCS